MTRFKRYGADPYDWTSVDPEIEECNAEFRDQIYKEMTDQIFARTAKAFALPPPLLYGDSNFASAMASASQTIIPNPDLPEFRGDSLKTEIKFRPCKWMETTKTRKRPCTNRRNLWMKWHATKTTSVPDPAVYVFGDYWCGHPVTIAKLMTALEALDKSQKEINPLNGGIYVSMPGVETLLTIKSP